MERIAVTETELIVDCELRVLHPDARRASYASVKEPVVTEKIYNHVGFKHVKNQLSAISHIHAMAANGVGFALISGLGWRTPEIRLKNNEYVAWSVRRHPKHFRGFFVIDSTDVKRSLREVETLDESRFIGVEIMNNYSGGHIDDRRIQPILDHIRERNLILKVYAAHPIQTLDGDSPYRLLTMIKRNPELKIIIGHLGGLLCLYGLLPEIQSAMKNVYFITSVSSTMKMVEFAAQVNPGNILFGSDAPFNHCYSQDIPLKKLKSLKLDRDTKKTILGRNACSLIKI